MRPSQEIRFPRRKMERDKSNEDMESHLYQNESSVMERTNKMSQPIYQWDYDQEIVTRYIRIGQCTKCGACCRGFLKIYVASRYDPEIPQQGGKDTTGEGIWMEVNQNGRRVFFKLGKFQKLEKKCSHLSENNECASYTKRPLFCQVFPLAPQNIVTFPECTYTFQKTGEWTFKQLGIKELVRE
jgi:Fe-S-cluster containining protein